MKEDLMLIFPSTCGFLLIFSSARIPPNHLLAFYRVDFLSKKSTAEILSTVLVLLFPGLVIAAQRPAQAGNSARQTSPVLVPLAALFPGQTCPFLGPESRCLCTATIPYSTNRLARASGCTCSLSPLRHFPLALRT